MRAAGMEAPAPERYDATQGQFRFDEAEIGADIAGMLLDYLNDGTTEINISAMTYPMLRIEDF